MHSAVDEFAEILDEIRQVLPKLVQACVETSDLFYASAKEPMWDMLGILVEGIDDLYKTLNMLGKHLEQSCGFNTRKELCSSFANEIAARFADLNQLVDQEAFLEAGDYLRYELAPLFDSLSLLLGDNDSELQRRFKNNVSYLKQHFPRAYSHLTTTEWDSAHYELFRAKDGTANLCVPTADGRQVAFYSRYCPQDEAARWVQQNKSTFETKSNVIVYGFGFGYHAEALQQHYPDVNLYVYEPDEQIFLAAMHVIDLKELSAKVHIRDLVIGRTKTHRDGLFYRYLQRAKGDTATSSLPVYAAINNADRQEFFEDAKIAIQNYASSRATYQKFGFEWTKNILFNISKSIDTYSLKELRNRFADVSAVVIGAGPSLAEDIEYVRKLKDHALLIAAGSSIQSLKHFGIAPHLIVLMDGSEVNKKIYGEDTKEVPFLYSPQSQYEIVESRGAYAVHTYLKNDIISPYFMATTEDDPSFASSHSVTSTAIQAAVYMGCKEIIFTGQDLSYPDNQVYAPGAKHFSEERLAKVIAKADLTVENVQGTLNRTTKTMKITLAGIGDILGHYPNVSFINTSSRGAKIKNTSWEPIQAVTERLASRVVSSTIVQEALDRYGRKYDAERIRLIRSRVAALPLELAALGQRLERITRQLNKLPELSRLKPLKCLDMMATIEKEWSAIVKGHIFNTLYLTALRNEIYQFDRDRPEIAAEKNTIRKAAQFCEIVGGLIHKMQEETPRLIEVADEAAKRLNVQKEYDQ